MDDLHESLAHFQVPATEHNDVVALVEGTKDSIIVVPPLQSPPTE